ncbi:MFS transporter [Scrofimicrobium sp. R131]|uniref:MFS transporter n=2 Tax=root TaxID=1 RepID=A0AAU7V8W8_9ACTO
MNTTSGLWQGRAYVLWLISDTAKGLGGSLFGFALPLIALFLTDDPVAAGIVGAVSLTLRLICTLGGGWAADRFHRIGLMIAGALLSFLLAALLLGLTVTDNLAFSSLLVVTSLMSVRGGLFDVAGESALKDLVPAHQVGRAQATNQGRDAVLQLLGGPLGGFLLGAGIWVLAAVMTLSQAVSALFAVLLGRRVSRHGYAGTQPESAPQGTGGMKQALSWLLHRREIRQILFVFTAINLGFGTGMTTVIYSLQQEGYSAAQIGLLSFWLGVSMLLGAMVSPKLIDRFPVGPLSVAGLALATAGFVLVPFMHTLPAIIATLAVCTVLIPLVNAGLLGYFMVATPTSMLGRANSIVQFLAMMAAPLAPLVAGIGLVQIGRTGTLLLSAAVCVLATLMAGLDRGARGIPRAPEWPAYAEKFEVRVS